MANTYLQRTLSASSSREQWTFSAWVKISGNPTGSYGYLFSCTDASNHTARISIMDNNVAKFGFVDSLISTNVQTNRLLRDNNGWYHLMVVLDTTLSTASDRVKLYVNGVRETSLANTTYPSVNAGGLINYVGGGYRHNIGSYNNGSSNFFNGCMSHVHFADGQTLAPTVFGETDIDTGEWKIKVDPTFTPGTNGFTILKDGNTITDQSSGSNDWSLGGGTLTKTEDNPSNVFATIQFVGHPGNVTLNNGNLVLDGENENDWKKSFTSTLGASSGKYYWEVKLGIDGENTTDYNITGIVRSDKTWTNSTIYSNGGFNGLQSANSAGGLGIYSQTGASMGSALYIGGSSVALTNGDIVMYAVDLDNKKMWVGKNGVWANAGSGGGVGNPSTGANELWGTGEFTTGAIYLPASSIYYDNSQAYNFGNGYFKTTAVSSAGTNASGNGIFEYDVPSGYTALSTKGLNT